MRQPVRVVLADDHDAFVEGLGMVLSAEGDLEIVALAGDGASALQAVRAHRPDVLVVDAQMPGPAVTELVRLVGQAEPATRVLLLAEDINPSPATQPAPGHPAGMSRAATARELAQAIRAVAAGFRMVAPEAPPGGAWGPHSADAGAPEREGSRPPEGMLGAVHSPDRAERDHHAELLLRSLSERERQVLDLLSRGYSNRHIAEVCYLSLNTVRTHVQNVLVKLGVHSKLEAAALAVRQGLVRIEDHPGRRPVPSLEVVVRGCRPARSSQVPQGRRRWAARRGAGLVALALAVAGRATVAVLTRELVAGDRPARIGVRTGLLAEGEGFSGFLVGAGSGALDHRAAALVQGSGPAGAGG